MEMFLMAVCISVFGMGVAALAFGAATRKPSIPLPPPAIPVAKAAPARFFVAPAIPEVASHQIPIEALLAQIENHVRVERAAAESFVQFPTNDMLHSKTTSSFVN
jgi:hypothetical protein